MNGKVTLQRAGPIATITMDRPEKLNALTAPMRRNLIDTLTDAAHDPLIAAVILTGAGGAFCAGGDIGTLQKLKANNDQEGFVALLDEGRQAVDLLRTMPKPTIAMIDGPAQGGGCILALACDLRYCSERATFGLPMITIGLGSDWGGTHMLVELVGPARAFEILGAAQILDAEEAYALRLVNRVHPAEMLSERVTAFAQRFANHPQASLARLKRTIAVARSGSFDATAEVERECQLENFNQPECADLITAFLDKRPSHTT
jgi:2-(1,2-epoxy-1,2-dihydrophenyl)acetyl-CoA isomerase